MTIQKTVFIMLVTLSTSLIALADEPGNNQGQQQQQPPPQGYGDGNPYGGGYGPGFGPGYGGGCGSGCFFNPGQNYYCGPNCQPPVFPYPPQVIPVPVPLPPVYAGPPVVAPPIYYPPQYPVYPQYPIYPRYPVYPGPHYGYHPPPMGGPPYGGIRPGPAPHPGGFRRMSFDGCEVQQGNNGQFVVLSTDGDVIYTDSSPHASANADYMKAYYEASTTGLCPLQKDSTKSVGI